MVLLCLAALLPLVSLGTAKFAATPLSELVKSKEGHLRLAARDEDLSARYPAYNFSVPIDHFHNDTQYEPHSNGTFNLRYWFDDTYYKPGGPIILFEGGEASALSRLPILQKGIVQQLSNATGGLGVIIEHRYYGTSIPTPDLSTENLRFLTTDQAIADVVYFAKNIKFKGHEHQNLGPKTTPWIAYGGSYSGAFVAFMRKLYPDVFFGAISSSGVTEAIWDYSAYFEPVTKTGPPQCIQDTQFVTDVVDKILIHNKTATEIQNLKRLFGLQAVEYDNDFANALTGGIFGWQGMNWDPSINDPTVQNYCGNLTSASLSYPGTAGLTPQIKHTLQVAGYDPANKTLVRTFQNYVGYVNATAVSPCVAQGESTNDCFTTHDPATYAQDDISQTWRSWPYQYCNQWGFLQTGNTPKDVKPLISRTIDTDYMSIICRDAFNISKPADVGAINKHGGYAISYPRLAILDGRRDPWKEATPHAELAPQRNSTVSEPFILISDGVHHWDENGLFPNETTASLPPKPVADAQAAEQEFVKEWLKDFAPRY